MSKDMVSHANVKCLKNSLGFLMQNFLLSFRSEILITGGGTQKIWYQLFLTTCKTHWFTNSLSQNCWKCYKLRKCWIEIFLYLAKKSRFGVVLQNYWRCSKEELIYKVYFVREKKKICMYRIIIRQCFIISLK